VGNIVVSVVAPRRLRRVRAANDARETSEKYEETLDHPADLPASGGPHVGDGRSDFVKNLAAWLPPDVAKPDEFP